MYIQKVYTMDDDDFFDADPFSDMDSIFNQLIGRRAKPRKAKQESNKIDFIESEDYIYCTIELPGYTEKDLSLTVKNGVLEVQAQRKSLQKVQDYLSSKFQEIQIIQRSLPESVNPKKFTHTYKNGILEVRFGKA